MLLGDVDDFVREDTGELGLVFHQPKQALRDVNETAGRGERVDAFSVEHHELPVEAGARTLQRQHCPDERDVLGDVGVLVDAERLDDLVADGLADLAFFGVGHFQVGDLLDGRRLVQRAGDASELRRRRTRAESQRRRDRDAQDECTLFHTGFSSCSPATAV